MKTFLEFAGGSLESRYKASLRAAADDKKDRLKKTLAQLKQQRSRLHDKLEQDKERVNTQIVNTRNAIDDTRFEKPA